MSVTAEVSQLPMSWLNDDALLNIEDIPVTLEVSHPPMSWLNDDALANIKLISETASIPTEVVGTETRFEHPSNAFCMLVKPS